MGTDADGMVEHGLSTLSSGGHDINTCGAAHQAAFIETGDVAKRTPKGERDTPKT